MANTLMRQHTGLVNPLAFNSGALTHTTLAAAVASLSGSDGAIVVTPGTWTIADHLVIPEHVELVVAPGALLSVSSTKTLTLNGPLTAGPRQVFTGAGTVAGGTRIGDVSAAWFGVIPDTGADMTAGLQAACDMAASGDRRRAVILPAGIMHVTGLDLSEKPLTIRGLNRDATILRNYDNSDHIIKINNAAQKTGWVFLDFRIDGRDGSGTRSTVVDGFSLTNVVLAQFHRMYVTSCRYGWDAGNGTVDCSWYDCVFGSNNVIGLRISSTGTNTFHGVIGGWVNENIETGISINSTDNVVTGVRMLDNTGTHIVLGSAASGNVIIGNRLRKGTSLDYGTAHAIDCFGNNNFISSNKIEKMSDIDVLFRSGSGNNNKFTYNDIPDDLIIQDQGSGNILPYHDSLGRHFIHAGMVAGEADLARYSDRDTGLKWGATNELVLLTGAVSALIARATGAVDITGVVSPRYQTVAAAGGAAAIEMGSANVAICWGSGVPTMSAQKGSLYLRTDGSGTSDRMYVNTNGSTGWTAVTTAS